MSTPEQPDSPGLTRKQMREIRMTGSTPVITDADLEASAIADAEAPAAEVESSVSDGASETSASSEQEQDASSAEPELEQESEQEPVEPPVAAVPLPRAAVPVVAAPLPTPDAQVDLGVSPLTRRQAREQERIRTASVPVITPDLAAAAAGSEWAPPVPASEAPQSEAPVVETEAPVVEVDADTQIETEPEPEPEELPAPSFSAETATSVDTGATVEAVDVEADADEAAAVVEAPLETDEDSASAEAPAAEGDAAAEGVAEPEEDRPVLRPGFGSTLLAGATGGDSIPPSFDDLIARGGSSTGSLATSNALILSQSPTGALTSPVTATGEVLITGTFNLPDGLGSQGHAHGTADGKETDSVLIDGELPPASSPTPIAASAAISTVKGTGEIIRPPAPEKGNKLMLSLAITAGVLAVALVGVLILAFVTGVF